MHWHWKIRLYNVEGFYAHAQVLTPRDPQVIVAFVEFYRELTGCIMLIEAMQEEPWPIRLPQLREAFRAIWQRQDEPLNAGADNVPDEMDVLSKMRMGKI